MISDWICFESGRKIFVDELQHRLLIEEPDGRFRVYGRKGTGPGEFRYPRRSVALDSRVYVVDSWNHRVQAFELPEWKYGFEFGGFGTGPGQLFCPSCIAVVPMDGRQWLVIADTNNSRLSFHRPDGCFAFASDLPRFPIRVRVLDEGVVEVQYEDRTWERVTF